MKIRQDNNLTDRTSMVFAKKNWVVVTDWIGAVYDQNQTKQ